MKLLFMLLIDLFNPDCNSSQKFTFCSNSGFVKQKLSACMCAVSCRTLQH